MFVQKIHQLRTRIIRPEILLLTKKKTNLSSNLCQLMAKTQKIIHPRIDSWLDYGTSQLL